MDFLRFSEEAVRKNSGLPRDIFLEVTPCEKSGFVMFVIDIIAVKIPNDFGQAIPVELVNDALLSGGEGVEPSENHLSVAFTFE